MIGSTNVLRRTTTLSSVEFTSRSGVLLEVIVANVVTPQILWDSLPFSQMLTSLSRINKSLRD